MAVFIKFSVITSMRPVMDFLDSIAFSSTWNDFIALFISVVWLSRVCAVALLVLACSGIGVGVH